jgi:hypothetical protein
MTPPSSPSKKSDLNKPGIRPDEDCADLMDVDTNKNAKGSEDEMELEPIFSSVLHDGIELYTALEHCQCHTEIQTSILTANGSQL